MNKQFQTQLRVPELRISWICLALTNSSVVSAAGRVSVTQLSTRAFQFVRRDLLEVFVELVASPVLFGVRNAGRISAFALSVLSDFNLRAFSVASSGKRVRDCVPWLDSLTPFLRWPLLEPRRSGRREAGEGTRDVTHTPSSFSIRLR